MTNEAKRSEESGSTDEVLGRHPTLAECEAAGRGPEYNGDKYSEGGLPNTPEERERFEAYMRGHCWDAGGYDHKKNCYDSVGVRMLYGVWRDRGALPTVWPNGQLQPTA